MATTPGRNRRPSRHVEPHGLPATARHYIQDLVYGANDGIITTFAVVAGVAGGSLAPAAVLIVGAANLAADGLSMGVGNYLSIRARESALEAQALPEEEAAPARHGFATFAAFVVAGALPLLPYVLPISSGTRAVVSVAVTLTALFAIGAARTLVTAGRWWRVGLEVLILGALVGAAAYGAGVLVAGVLQGTRL
jgi:VIT1/CCC1 family predicted Fe2+/Mn2+ transporter